MLKDIKKIKELIKYEVSRIKYDYWNKGIATNFYIFHNILFDIKNLLGYKLSFLNFTFMLLINTKVYQDWT